MKECSKSIQRRLATPNFARRYFVGDGIDIGGKPDPLVLYAELFPLLRSVRTWDLEDGDAQYLESVSSSSCDFVHSSHCLEHLNDPLEGLKNWYRVLRPSGYMIVTVPDEDLYEQGAFPSTHNRDHKWTFTIHKKRSWSPRSLNILDLVLQLDESAQLVKVELLDATYRNRLPRYDQTLTPVSESGIEVIVRKQTLEEIDFGGVPPRREQVSREMRIHLNQYRDDIQTLKSVNKVKPPFQNDSEI